MDYTIGAQSQHWEWTRQNKQDQLWEAPLVVKQTGSIVGSTTVVKAIKTHIKGNNFVNI